MTIYKNSSSVHNSGSPLELIKQNSLASGNISKILITNHDDSDSCVIKLYLKNTAEQYIIAETTIPPRVSLILEDNLSFESDSYALKMETTTDAELTIIIK